MERLIFDKSVQSRPGVPVPQTTVPRDSVSSFIPEKFLRSLPLNFPSLSELDVVRHYTALAHANFSVDANFYPLGSCTMKYNPKLNELAAQKQGFSELHPYAPEEQVQGALKLLSCLEQFLCEITGMSRFTFQPAAGAHGELCGILMIRAYHHSRRTNKTKVLIPDSAHGTNPASCAMAGYEVVEIKSGPDGLVDIDTLKKHISEDTAALMLTNPNTVGLFEKKILEIAEIVHSAGALLYYDGANLNALLGVVRPADIGFDIMHINLHKTCATPHGGGGPGAGPVGVVSELMPFLPVPLVEQKAEKYYLNYDLPYTIGKMRSFYGNFSVCIKAYIYLLSLGQEYIRDVARYSVLNANYIRAKLKDLYELAYDACCMHEVVFSAKKEKAQGVSALDIAKRLIDFGIHPPTVYFPLIVKEALMIEPTETESKETLDRFIEVMRQIAHEIKTEPGLLKNAPLKTALSRLDEAKAARELNLRWRP